MKIIVFLLTAILLIASVVFAASLPAQGTNPYYKELFADWLNETIDTRDSGKLRLNLNASFYDFNATNLIIAGSINSTYLNVSNDLVVLGSIYSKNLTITSSGGGFNVTTLPLNFSWLDGILQIAGDIFSGGRRVATDSNINENITAVNALTNSKITNNITDSNTLTDNKINSNRTQIDTNINANVTAIQASAWNANNDSNTTDIEHILNIISFNDSIRDAVRLNLTSGSTNSNLKNLTVRSGLSAVNGTFGFVNITGRGDGKNITLIIGNMTIQTNGTAGCFTMGDSCL